MMQTLFYALLLVRTVHCFVHPIAIHGRYFHDTVTREPFFLKGVDYQPGGSSAVTEDADPLSNPDTCARDIILFQELNINTIRVYSIKPELNHDICMTLLASAGIYLVLDVNSPIQGQHLNRYEPWLTYTEEYLEHVFKIIEQFSGYNNTLGFFAGNEIINDKKSARNSPSFVKSLIGDMKAYISQYSSRLIPVGYSAADDLSFRIPLSKYLECSSGSLHDSVDFYGVNTYQWCGEQTFYTSGYDVLVNDYDEYVHPVFFSEFGCNVFSPRVFEEVGTMYSNHMVGVFSGGMVYEFSQEPNNYGLVKILPSGNVKVYKDFDNLKAQYNSVKMPTGRDIAALYNAHGKGLKLGAQQIPECDEVYDNLDISHDVDPSISAKLLKNGVETLKGRFVNLIEDDLFTSYNITTSSGAPFPRNFVKVIQQIDQVSAYEAMRLEELANEGMLPPLPINFPHFDTGQLTYLSKEDC